VGKGVAVGGTGIGVEGDIAEGIRDGITVGGVEVVQAVSKTLKIIQN
jgi:hypothetical protein